MGVPIFYGTCHGGPYDGKQLADHREVVPTAIEKARPMRSIPGMVRSSDPAIVFGAYKFEHDQRIWVWEPPSSRPSDAKTL
jgi:hypothetical protein